MVEFKRESDAAYKAREIAQGIARPPIEVDPASLRDVAIVNDGVVVGVVLGAHADPFDISGTVVELSSAVGLVIGEALPWPRARRDAMLAATDWTELRSDKPQEWRDAWAAYRTALRELPDTQPDPAAIIWPNEPPR